MKNKFIILGDMHIGARNANITVMEHQLYYFEQVFFPYLKKHNITTILQLGDLFDTRKFSNHLILHNWKRRFFDYMETAGIEFITLLGNHDIVFKNTIDVNSSTLFLSHYDNITIIDKATEVGIMGVSFLLVPWICAENREDIIEKVKNTSSVYCAGHFEFAGFEINPGQVCDKGEDKSIFEKFDVVYSGHFHTKSHKDNIQYVGIPYELTWIDYNDPKGFFVFDTRTRTTEYIQNTIPLFVKIYYDDKDKGSEYFKTIKCNHSSNSYVKLIVTNKTDIYQFDKLFNKISALQPIELRIMDELEDFDNIEMTEDELKVEATVDLIDSFVKQTDTTLDKERVSVILKSLYVEALNLS